MAGPKVGPVANSSHRAGTSRRVVRLLAGAPSSTAGVFMRKPDVCGACQAMDTVCSPGSMGRSSSPSASGSGTVASSIDTVARLASSGS